MAPPKHRMPWAKYPPAKWNVQDTARFARDDFAGKNPPPVLYVWYYIITQHHSWKRNGRMALSVYEDRNGPKFLGSFFLCELRPIPGGRISDYRAVIERAIEACGVGITRDAGVAAPRHPPYHYDYRRWLDRAQIRWDEMREWWNDLASGDTRRVKKVADELREMLDSDGVWYP